MTQGRSAAIVGATSQVAHFLIPMLCEADYDVVAISRSSGRARHGECTRWRTADVTVDQAVLADTDVNALIYLAPLATLATVLSSVDELSIKRIIAFSSTSVLTKGKSSDAKERRYVRQLREAEQTIMQRCQVLGVVLTIFRPTLIYGLGIDRNVSFIARCIQATGVFPIADGASGRRQPVHAQDLASACMQSMHEPGTFNKTYTLAGAETMTYKEMVIRIFTALNRRPRILRLPVFIYKLSLRLMKFSPRFRYLISPAMAERMNQDMVFDNDAAARDFGFAPRDFQPTRGELLLRGARET